MTNRGKRDYKQGQLKGFQIGAEQLAYVFTFKSFLKKN